MTCRQIGTLDREAPSLEIQAPSSGLGIPWEISNQLDDPSVQNRNPLEDSAVNQLIVPVVDLFVQSAFQADVCRWAVSKLKHIKLTAPQVAVITIEPKPIVFVDSIRSVDSISSFPYNSVSNQVASQLV